MTTKPTLSLKDFSFSELFKPSGLLRLDKKFLQSLQSQAPALYDELIAYRYKHRDFTAIQASELLLACAPLLEQFIAELFGIDEALTISRLRTLSNDPIFIFKQFFVLREAKHKAAKVRVDLLPFNEIDSWLSQQIAGNKDAELAVAKLACHYLADSKKYSKEIANIIDWCVYALTYDDFKSRVATWVSFKLPKPLDYKQLVATKDLPADNLARFTGFTEDYRRRDGFKLTDNRMTEREVLNEVNYCIYCHKTAGDFCSKGFPNKKGDLSQGFKKNPLDEYMTGCPLEQNISEMHVLKKAGHTIAALAMIMVDNPFCPVTGHRICNECMKACIYQKQDPVDIPQTETGILSDALSLPWGVEIYDLLTRWNPLRQEQYIAKDYNGLKVLIMGMGPAGFTLAHHLLMEGFAVVGADGLKIEPLPECLLTEPIYSFADIKEPLDERITLGFGGVIEYGITVRWDKNFLKLIYISLLRRPCFQVFGGVRFGGTIKVEDAWELGFDHLAIAVGAGLAKELPIINSMAPGMRQANDFLMALQLTGAAKMASLANLQLRLPVVVIGGGLTAIDAATEAQAYYIAQVTKFAERYAKLIAYFGKDYVVAQFPEPYFAICQEFLAHAKEVADERKRAAKLGEKPDFVKLIHKWGGVTVVYRRSLQESPAYRHNHGEVREALKEGIYYAENSTPIVVNLDKYGHVAALACSDKDFTTKVFPAKAILVATGAKPNIAYEFEHRGTFKREELSYQGYDLIADKLEVISQGEHCKVENFGAFTSYAKDDHRVTFLGDTNPLFHGSVVKAIASAKRIYPKIVASLKQETSGDMAEYRVFATKIAGLFTAHIIDILRHNKVLAITIHAPQAAKNFAPGQFYRLQNYESLAPVVAGTKLQAEAMAMVGAKVDKSRGLITLNVLEQGANSRLFATLKPQDHIAIMGPTGVPTKITVGQPETVLVIGDILGVAYTSAVGPELRAAGHKVLYVAAFKDGADLYYQTELEQAADVILWVAATGKVKARRPQDWAVTSGLAEALVGYARGDFYQGQELLIDLASINRVLIVGASNFIRIVRDILETTLKPFLTQQPKVTASIYGPMQCMLKGVCAQCLQWQVDHTGKRTKAVFACSWQDQPLEIVDLDNLDERLSQNLVQETMSNLWLDYLFANNNIIKY